MTKRKIETRERWTVIATYEIDSDTAAEAVEEIQENSASYPTVQGYELIEREVEKVLEVEEEPDA